MVSKCFVTNQYSICIIPVNEGIKSKAYVSLKSFKSCRISLFGHLVFICKFRVLSNLIYVLKRSNRNSIEEVLINHSGVTEKFEDCQAEIIFKKPLPDIA